MMRRAAKSVYLTVAATMIAALLQFGVMGTSSPVQGAENTGIQKKLENALVLYIGSPLACVNNKDAFIDPDNVEVMPVIKNGSTLVPVRFISESLGASVDWDGNTSTAAIRLGEKQVSLTVNSDRMVLGNQGIKLEAPAEIRNGRLLVPLRALSEALGKKVFYDKGLIVISDDEGIFNAQADKAAIDTLISKMNNLPVVGSYEKLKELVSKSGYGGYHKGDIAVAAFSTTDASSSAKSSAPANKSQVAVAEGSAAGNADYSRTNVQVEGVDEGDIIKTDGKYIYQVNKQRVIIADAYPAEEMKVLSILNYTGVNFNPVELYLHGDEMVVIGNEYREVMLPEQPAGSNGKPYYPRQYARSTTKAIIYDITDKSNIKRLREVEVEGNYLSSRKIGPALYLISNKYVDYYLLENNLEGATPCFRDTAVKENYAPVSYSEIRYFPETAVSNYMTVAGINLDKNDEAAKIATYLGAGDNIYASEQNLYVATARAKLVEEMQPQLLPDSQVGNKPGIIMKRGPRYESNTVVYKFSLNQGNITYLCKGEIPGNVLNQFSMDEYGRSFRIATTIHNAKVDNTYTSTNQVYIADDMLNITGKIENMAPGERIYSVRFMGKRGYVVTFKNVDPLFVIDLSDPQKPSILGALKIPGYSDYLHPYDENHIIGFGKDTVEIPNKDFKGNPAGSTAYYQGMKLAVFDVTDVSNPIQKFTEFIGDRGTDSELLRNHKALLFSKEKNLLAFPVTVAEVQNKGAVSNTPNQIQYGSFVFQGAYVYHIDLTDGFKLKGKITHLTDQEYLKSGNGWYGGDKNVERILYIGDHLYTLSKGMIKANKVNDLKEVNKVTIP